MNTILNLHKKEIHTFCWLEVKVQPRSLTGPILANNNSKNHDQLSLVSPLQTANAIGYIPSFPSIPTVAKVAPLKTLLNDKRQD